MLLMLAKQAAVAMLRALGRRRLAWRVFVEAVQEARWDDDPLPSDVEIRKRAERAETNLFRQTFGPR